MKKQQDIHPGSLVITTKKIYLTPLDNIDNDWPVWDIGEIGTVMFSSQINEKNFQICVMVPSGFGYCFFDEIKVIA